MKKKLLILTATFILAIISLLLMIPSNNRDWSEEQAILPSAQIKGNLVTVHNIRNFNYKSTTEFTAGYYNKTFDLNKVKRVWYGLVPFSGVPGSAHTFLSFEFSDNSFLAVSVEARREKGETFSAIKGLFNKFELMYILADERDAIKLRSNYHQDSVYLYPGKASPEETRALLIDILERVNKLETEPEFYNTIFNSCIANIVYHINKLTPDQVSLLNWRIIFPATSDKLAYKLKFLDTDLSLAQARAKYLINDRALKYATDPDFSLKIRPEN